MYAVIYRQELTVWVDREMDVCCNIQELTVWVDREMDVCCNIQTGVNSVGGQGDGCVL